MSKLLQSIKSVQNSFLANSGWSRRWVKFSTARCRMENDLNDQILFVSLFVCLFVCLSVNRKSVKEHYISNNMFNILVC